MDESHNYSRMIQFRRVEFTKQEDRKDLRYGDFIQIRSLGCSTSQGNTLANQELGPGSSSDSKKGNKVGEGWIVCESNYSGFKPNVMYRRVKNGDFKNLLAYDSIFEIIPSKISLWG